MDRKCVAELCPSWTGHGCFCAVMGVAPADDLFDDAPPQLGVPHDERGFGPVFTAGYSGEDSCCGEGIREGEDIRADGAGGWIHALPGCEGLGPEKPGAVLVTQACRSCFLIHSPGQKECA